MNDIQTSRSFKPSASLMKNLLSVAIVGAAITIIGLVLAPERTWPNLLLATYYLLGLGIAGGTFIALLYVSNAGWAVALRRVPEAMLSLIPVAGVLMLVLLIGIPTLYEWSHPSAVAHDPLLQSKTWWLNIPFFTARTVFYLILWLLLTAAIARNSRRQDIDGSVLFTAKNTRLSAVFLVVFGLTYTLASMDWIMSIEPHWYSTIFGIYNFSGMFLNGLAAITLVVILLKRMGPFRSIVTESHLHSLGKLIFAFATFWMYIWFSQYLLIWYANIPEEVPYLIRREEGSWLIFTVVNVLFNWAIPFIVLLPRWTKINEGLLLKVCIIVMIGHWIDLFWMILPPFMPEAPFLSLWDVGPIAAAIAVFFRVTYLSLGKAPVVPVRDPLLVESIHYHS